MGRALRGSIKTNSDGIAYYDMHTRLPADVGRWLVDRAMDNDRPLNSELERILRKVKDDDEQEKRRG